MRQGLSRGDLLALCDVHDFGPGPVSRVSGWETTVHVVNLSLREPDKVCLKIPNGCSWGELSNRLMERIGPLVEGVLDLLFPPRCVVCGKLGEVLCSSCVADFPRLGEPACPICGAPGHTQAPCPSCPPPPLHIEQIQSAYLFEGGLRKAIHALKYQRQRRLAGPLAEAICAVILAEDGTNLALCPVPLHPKRLTERGFNQAELIVSELAVRWGIPVLEGGALRRVRETRSQVDLGRTERLTNVQGAFAAEPELVRGRRVLLFDDVCTTGVTLAACGEALWAAGAEQVSALTLARTSWSGDPFVMGDGAARETV